MDLVILAAGMGSRFGGLKQLEPIDNNKDFIIDYSVFDAIASGFDNITFIIRKQNEKIFKNTIGSRINKKANVNYVFQENDSAPNTLIPKGRTKPLGTAHAILCCKDTVRSPFMIINADDFYGRHSYEIAADFIKNKCSEKTFGCIAYEAGKTLTENGSVKRGICQVKDDNVIGIIESTLTCNSLDNIDAKPLNGDNGFQISNNTPVSMNMFILSPSIFDILDSEFIKFLENTNDPMKDEFLLPDVISKTVNEGKAELKLVKSDETWFGVTYPEDKQDVVDAIENMRKSGRYPEKLWN